MRVYISENWRIADGHVCAAISFAAAVAGRSAAAARLRIIEIQSRGISMRCQKNSNAFFLGLDDACVVRQLIVCETSNVANLEACTFRFNLKRLFSCYEFIFFHRIYLYNFTHF